MCNLEHGTRRERTLLRRRSEHSGFYAFYRHHTGGFAMIAARGRHCAPRCYLRVEFFLQVKHLRTLTCARWPVTEDESLRRQHCRLKWVLQDLRELQNSSPT